MRVSVGDMKSIQVRIRCMECEEVDHDKACGTDASYLFGG